MEAQVDFYQINQEEETKNNFSNLKLLILM